MVDLTDLYLLNLLLTAVLMVATLYRVKIERDHTKAVLDEMLYKKKLVNIRNTLIREEEMILNMETAKDIKDFYAFLLECLKDENNP